MVLGPAVDKPRVEPQLPRGVPVPGDDADLPPTPEDIQVNPANLDEFDRTYLARREEWRLTGPRPSPAPFPLQVLPRMAFTINYNFVFDETEGEWVPQNPFSGGGGGVFEIVFSDIRTVPATGFETIDLPITMGELDGDVLIPAAAIPAGTSWSGGNVVHQEGGGFGDDILYELKYQDFDNQAVQMLLENTTSTDQDVQVKVFRG